MAQLLDNAERSARGLAIQTEITGNGSAEGLSLLEETWRDFIFAEVWAAPALDRRARYLVALAACVVAGADEETFDGFVQGALRNGDLGVAELREAALHMGPYGGFTKARALDRAITRAVAVLGIADEATAPLRGAPWDPEVRDREGAAEYLQVVLSEAGPPAGPYLRAIRDFVFGEMWVRRALDERSRRWLTLVGVCDSMADVPIRSHVHAAMASGNCTAAEMHEFVLQFAIHCGWPKASVALGAVFEMQRKVEAGLAWNA